MKILNNFLNKLKVAHEMIYHKMEARQKQRNMQKDAQ